MIKAFRQFGRLKAVDGEYQGMVKCLKVFGKFLRENRLLYHEISFDISIIRLYIIRVLTSAVQFHIRLIVTFCTWIVSIWSERI